MILTFKWRNYLLKAALKKLISRKFTMCTISCLKNEFTNGDNASSATSSMHHNNGSPINTESIQEREIPI